MYLIAVPPQMNALELTIEGKMDSGPALLFVVDRTDEGEAHADVDRHVVADSRLDSKARADEERVVVGTFAPDAASVEEDIGVGLLGRRKGNGVFHASHNAAVAAEQAFRIAADAVHAAYVELFSRRQVLGAAELSVQACRNHLSRRKGLLI